MVISLINQKGGVGKTTTAFHLGAALAAGGSRVLWIDLDPQRNLLFLTEGCQSDNLRAVGWDGGDVEELLRGESFDFALLDCPPALGEGTATALARSQLAIAPTPPRVLDLVGLSQLRQTVGAVHERSNPLLKLRILLTMREPRLVLQRDYEAQLRGAFAHEVFGTAIPKSALFDKAATVRQPVALYSPASPGALAYQALAKEVMQLA